MTIKSDNKAKNQMQKLLVDNVSTVEFTVGERRCGRMENVRSVPVSKKRCWRLADRNQPRSKKTKKIEERKNVSE